MERMNYFLSSLYFGDRWCERMEVEGDRVIIQVNNISRVQKGTKEWNYYTKEDIEHGCLVFEEVSEFSSNSDMEFNDEIYEVKMLEKIDEEYTFVVYGCNVSDKFVSTDLEYCIRAKRFYILNPQDNTLVTA